MEPLTSSEKSARFRKKNADAGRLEVRGVFATQAEQKVLKKMMRDTLRALRESPTQ